MKRGTAKGERMRLHDADAGAADERAEQSDERRGRDRESVLRIVVV